MRAEVLGRARAGFCRQFGREPAALAFAPGRVNLIGDHTDYQGGLSLPMAVAAGIAAAAAPRADARWRLASEERAPCELPDGPSVARAGPASSSPPRGHWARLVAGALAEGGVRAGLDLYLAADLAEGAGLSSSAAATLASLASVSAALGLGFDPGRACLACQRAENLWLGVPSGLMDELAVAFGRAGCAVRVDSEAGACAPVPFAPEADGFALWRVDVGARRSLGESAYRQRRAESEEAARRLGVPSLRHVDPGDPALARLPSPLDRRARHIVTENARVEAALVAAARRDWPEVGRLFDVSHRSLRDHYESSHPLLDRAQAALAALGPPVWARVTGGGFGGSLVALGGEGSEGALRSGLAGLGLRADVEVLRASPGLRMKA